MKTTNTFSIKSKIQNLNFWLKLYKFRISTGCTDLLEIETRIRKISYQLARGLGTKQMKHILSSALLMLSVSTTTVNAQSFADPLRMFEFAKEGFVFPSLGDFDNDGDLDIIGSNYQENTIDYYEFNFVYIENVGDAKQAVYEEVELNPFNLNANFLTDYAFFWQNADMDNDGDLDLLALGNSEVDNEYIAILKYIENVGTPFEAKFENVISQNITIEGYGRFLSLGDLDDDGDIDIIFNTGQYYTYSDYELSVVFIENTLETGVFALDDAVANPFGIKVLPLTGDFIDASYFSNTVVADFDNDGDSDLILYLNSFGQAGTKVLFAENLGNESFDEWKEINNLTQPPNLEEGILLFPTIGDLDEDGDIDILYALFSESELDASESNYYFVENLSIISNTEDLQVSQSVFDVYPTLASHTVNVKAKELITDIVHCKMVDSEGKVVYRFQLTQSTSQQAIDISSLVDGTYFIISQIDGRATQRSTFIKHQK